jgi:MFS family permease
MGVVVRSLLLGRLVDFLGEARLSRLGLVLLAAGHFCTGFAVHGGLPFLAALMPLGTAFLFPCVTGLLSRWCRAMSADFKGVQHAAGRLTGDVSDRRGHLIDRFGVGVPFWIRGASGARHAAHSHGG